MSTHWAPDLTLLVTPVARLTVVAEVRFVTSRVPIEATHHLPVQAPGPSAQ